MRIAAIVLATSLVAAGCGTHTYEIRSSELQRLAQIPPEQRGMRVRVVQQLTESDVQPVTPIDGNTEVTVQPGVQVDVGGGGDWGGGVRGGGAPRGASYGGGGGMHGGHGGGGGLGSLSGGGGDGKGEAIAILVAAAVILVAVAGIEASRFDGYAQLHPMQPLHIFGSDGGYLVMPLAWVDPATAAWADHAVLKTNEGPFRWLGKAPLDRQGLTYSLFFGVGTSTSVDGTTGTGTSASIQLGYFFDQTIGLQATTMFGWRNNAVGATLFDARYTLELQDYLVQSGPLHLGLFGGAGGASRFEDGLANADASSLAVLGGALLQLDIDTRIAITGRLSETYAYGTAMADAMIGLAVY